MKPNLTSIEEKFKTKDNQFLLDVAFATDDDYLPEVIAIAKKELTSRGVDIGSAEITELVSKRQDRSQKLTAKKQNAELAFYLKAICFLGTIILPVIIIVYHSSNAKKRATKDALKWWGYGWLFKISAAILVSFNHS